MRNKCPRLKLQGARHHPLEAGQQQRLRSQLEPAMHGLAPLASEPRSTGCYRCFLLHLQTGPTAKNGLGASQQPPRPSSPDVEECEKPYEGYLQDSETDVHYWLSSATSRKSSPSLHQFEGLRQLPISPLTPPLEIKKVSHPLMPAVIIRISAVPSLIPDHQKPQESIH